MNSQHSKVPLTNFVFFSHVAFIYLLAVRTISLSTTLSGLLDILRSVLNMDRGSGLSNLIRFDPSSAKGHSDSRMTRRHYASRRPYLISFSRSHVLLGSLAAYHRNFLQSVNVFG